MITPEVLARLLPAYMARQRWFATSDQLDFQVEIIDFEVWRDEWPGMIWALVVVEIDNEPVATYQVVIGLRSVDDYPHFLDGKGQWLLGDVTTSKGEALAYDAMIDPDLAIHLFGRIAPELEVARVRPLTVEQTNTSIIGDEQWILKMFRRLSAGVNPDVELARLLWDNGFVQTPEPIADWRYRDIDLAVVRRFFAGGTDGFVLAGTSLRDLYDLCLPPDACGADFAPESFRLGQVIATMHRALADVAGTTVVPTVGVVAEVTEELRRAEVPGVTSLDVEVWSNRMLQVLPDELVTSRIHGDLHLGQLLRTDRGWLVLDFEGEPARSVQDRVAFMSPWRDVGAMLRSYDYAAQLTLFDRADDEIDDETRDLGEQWRVRNRGAFLNGYRMELGEQISPEDSLVDPVVRFFELAKAVYEVGYERAHRADWAAIPEGAVRSLLGDV